MVRLLQLAFANVQLFQHGVKSAGFEFIPGAAHHGETCAEIQRDVTAAAELGVDVIDSPRAFASFVTRLMNSLPRMDEFPSILSERQDDDGPERSQTAASPTRHRVLVVDASVALDLLARFRPEPLETLLWAPATSLVAPELIGVEVLNALRRLDREGAIPATRRLDLPRQLRALRIRMFRHGPLLDGIWSLRGQVTAYDAAYVVLATALQAPLVTRDTRLARAVGTRLEVLSP